MASVTGLTITAVAVGQDHTLTLTDDGAVWSWGLNRFNQLGYVVESSKTVSGQDEHIQWVARRVEGVLLHQNVAGVAASKIASACWTSGDVFTWGTNRGQLGASRSSDRHRRHAYNHVGYSKSAQPVQILPRKVTPITAPVMSATLSDYALCVLLMTRDIICFAHDTHSRVVLSMQPFPPEITPSYSPSVVARTRYRSVEKIVSCEDACAIISEAGDVLTWTTGGAEISGSGGESVMVKPQRLWTSNRQLNSAKVKSATPHLYFSLI